MLVRSEEPVRSDAILVLAGDAGGNRIRKACELLQQGYAPVAYVSGPSELLVYGHNEADLAIAFARTKGCPADQMVPVRVRVLSTNDEARELSLYLRRRGVRSLLLVTNNYHTARSWREFHDALGSDVQLRTVAAPDRFFDPSTWWKTRQGQKTWLLEATKSFAGLIGL